MGVQKVHLALELFGVGPAVVPLASGQILSPGRREEHRVQGVDPLGKQVLLLVEGTDDVGVFLRIFPDDGGGAVGGGVVADQHLKGEIGALAHEALQRIPDIGFMVIGHTGHGELDGCLVHALNPHFFPRPR